MILEGVRKAFWLLVTFDPEVMGITLLSLQVSGTATLISLFLGVSVGVLLALSRFPGKKIVVSLINTGMGLPPVVVGLFVTVFLWRNGPLGFFGILYTPTAMIVAQAVIATPIVMGISLAAVQQLSGETPPSNPGVGATACRWSFSRTPVFSFAIGMSILLAAMSIGFVARLTS